MGITPRETGELVGKRGAFFRQTPGRTYKRGWTVFRRPWRRAYATEAARTALAYVFKRHAVPRAIAHVDGRRLRSASARTSGLPTNGDMDCYGECTGHSVIARRA